MVARLSAQVGIQFAPVSWHTPGFVGFKELSLCPAKCSSGSQMSCSLPCQTNVTLLTMHTNILTMKENIRSSRAAINQPVTGKNGEG